jgi:ATP-binding cassette subfamily B multidrug efflux pump
MFRFFEALLRSTDLPPDAPPPTTGERYGLWRFYWHFARQARSLIVALFFAGLLVAALDACT